MRGQQTCPLTIHFNLWTVSSDVSIQRRHCHSVHLWAYCTHPTHDVNDVKCEGWPQHRRLRPLLFSNSGVDSFTSHKNQTSVSAVRQDIRFSSLSEKTRKSNRLQMSLQRQHFLLSYLKTLSAGPVGVPTRDLPLSRPALSQLSQPGGGFMLLVWSFKTIECLSGCPHNRPFLSCSKPLYQTTDMEWFFIFMPRKLFITRKVSYLASFRKWGFLDLGKGVFMVCILF